ncbi:MAG: hypothetical protein R3C68_16975 [Myxococcota bacterium]
MVSVRSGRYRTISYERSSLAAGKGNVRMFRYSRRSGRQMIGECTFQVAAEPGLATCGDGECMGDEDCQSCATDCGECATCSSTEAFETSCGDGEDNDCDGLIDCDDTDCGECGTCSSTEAFETSCGDGEDNDCDGLIDCDDTDCSDACNTVEPVTTVQVTAHRRPSSLAIRCN